MLIHGGTAEVYQEISDGAALLARLQRPEGGMPSHAPGPAQMRSDATAQAVRIWILVDPARYRKEILKGLSFLEGSTASDGGLRYEPGSSHANVCSTIFALQAFQWSRDGEAAPAWLI
jgi:hypothetical protein